MAAYSPNGHVALTALEQPLRGVPNATARIEAAVREILIAIGEDPDRDGLVDTPARVARAAHDMFGGLRVDPLQYLTTVFDEAHDELVLVKDIMVASTCEHHLLPFFGCAHVGYVPGDSGRVTGLSKLARVVEGYARRPQVQERLTNQVADAIVRQLDPRGVIVALDCEHMCMSLRGVQKPGARTVTTCSRGVLRDDGALRREALDCLGWVAGR